MINSKEELQLTLLKIPSVYFVLRIIALIVLLILMMMSLENQTGLPMINKIFATLQSLPSLKNITTVCGVGLIGSSLYNMNIKHDNDMLSMAAGIASIICVVPDANKKTAFQLMLFVLGMFLIAKGAKTHKHGTTEINKQIGLYSIIYGIVILFYLFNLDVHFNFYTDTESVKMV